MNNTKRALLNLQAFNKQAAQTTVRVIHIYQKLQHRMEECHQQLASFFNKEGRFSPSQIPPLQAYRNNVLRYEKKTAEIVKQNLISAQAELKNLMENFQNAQALPNAQAFLLQLSTILGYWSDRIDFEILWAQRDSVDADDYNDLVRRRRQTEELLKSMLARIGLSAPYTKIVTLNTKKELQHLRTLEAAEGKKFSSEGIQKLVFAILATPIIPGLVSKVVERNPIQGWELLAPNDGNKEAFIRGIAALLAIFLTACLFSIARKDQEL